MLCFVNLVYIHCESVAQCSFNEKVLLYEIKINSPNKRSLHSTSLLIHDFDNDSENS